MSFDFDQIIDRLGTHGQKIEALERLFGRSDLIPLWVADMDFAAPPTVTQALITRAAHPIYGYTQTPDAMFEAMKNWFATRHQWSIAREEIVFCPGVVPSIHASILALTTEGDQVIVQSPVYFPFFSAVTETGRQLVLNPLIQTPAGYQMDFDGLEQLARAGAKLLVLCSPHNPVGRVWRASELQRLLDIAEHYQLTIISDEIHADIVFSGHQHIPLATLSSTVPIITTVSASKTFNIAGLGLSALIVEDKDIRQKIQVEFRRWHVSADNPFSLTATLTAYESGQDWLDALLVYLEDSRDWVRTFFVEHLPMLPIIQAEGTYLLWLDCRQLAMTDGELKQFFIHQAGVALNPGQLFGEDGKGFMRMNIASPRSVVMQACQQIYNAVQQHQKDE